MDNFVVYAFCREDGTFYYIGKGRPRRPFQKRNQGVKPPQDRSRIIILHKNLSEKIAFDYEEKLIAFYGRKDTNTGLLRNQTDGGEGVSGWVPKEEWREKKSERMSGSNNPFYGCHHTIETIEKARAARRENYNPENNYFFNKHFFGELNPMFGKKRPDLSARNKENPSCKGTKWYNNGEVDKRFPPDQVPDGFVPGRLKVARGHKRPDLAERNRQRGLQSL